MKTEVRGGFFRYPTRPKPVLQNIDLSVSDGEILAVLGPNGAGKTTLLRCLTGLLKWTQGDTLLDGKSVRSLTLKQLWQQISYVPQVAKPNVSCSVEEMILLGRASSVEAFSLPKKEDIEAADDVMDRLGLGAIRGRSVTTLSGGERQMVMIARALVSHPKLLVLDEPESGLDFRNQLIVLDLLSSLAADGITVIFNTHYPAHALRRADKALLIAREKTPLCGSASDLLTTSNLEAYFGVRSVIGSIDGQPDIIPISVL